MPIEIEEFIAAPTPVVFRAWTEPPLICRWWPHAATVQRCISDARPGGEFSLLVSAAGGQLYGFEARWTEVVAQRRLAYRGALVGMSGEVAMAIDFKERADGTVVRLVHEVSDEELPPAQMRAAWSAALDRLRQLLAAPESPA